MKKLGLALAMTALALLLSPVGAEAKAKKWNTRQKKLLAKRAAIADAQRKLVEQLRGLRIEAETYVRDFVAESDEIALDVRGIIKYAKLGKARYYEDGICEVEATLKIQTVVTELEKIVRGRYKGGKFKGNIFKKITQHYKQDVLTAIGTGAIAEDEEDTGGRGSRNNPLKAKGGRNKGFWRKVPAKHKLMAKRAAEADCYRKIAEQVIGVQIDAQTYVRDFVTESDEISSRTRGWLRFVKLERARYLEDGIVEVRGTVKLSQVLTTVDTMVNAKIKGNKVKMRKWLEVKQKALTIIIKATGEGTTKWGDEEDDEDEDDDDGESADFVDDDEPIVPAWARQVYKQVGKGAKGDDEELSEARRKLKAERAAISDARRKLLEYIKGLRIDARTTVHDFATESDEINTRVNGLIMGTRQDGKAKWSDDGIVEVTVILDLRDVWKIINARKKFRKGG